MGALSTRFSEVFFTTRNNRKKESPTVENSNTKENQPGMPLVCIQVSGGIQMMVRKAASKKGVMIGLMALSPPMMMTTAAMPNSHNQDFEMPGFFSMGNLTQKIVPMLTRKPCWHSAPL